MLAKGEDRTVHRVRKSLNVRRTKETEFLEVHRFIRSIDWLENYPKHMYKILLRYFGNTCFIAENEQEEIIGFVLGFKSQRHTDTYFLWQIGIHPSYQNEGLGAWLLSEIEKGLRSDDFEKIEVTVDPENLPSRKLFERLNYKNVSQKEGKIVELEVIPAVKDYYKPGRHFILYEKAID